MVGQEIVLQFVPAVGDPLAWPSTTALSPIDEERGCGYYSSSSASSSPFSGLSDDGLYRYCSTTSQSGFEPTETDSTTTSSNRHQKKAKETSPTKHKQQPPQNSGCHPVITSIIVLLLLLTIGATAFLCYLLFRQLEIDAAAASSANQGNSSNNGGYSSSSAGAASSIAGGATTSSSSTYANGNDPWNYNGNNDIPHMMSRDPAGSLIGDPNMYPIQPIAGLPAGAVVFPDANVDYLYAPSSTSKAVKSIGRGDFTMSVHLRGEEKFPQAQHPVILSNRRSTGQRSDYFIFGFHNQWRGTEHKIGNIDIAGINWIDYQSNNQNVLDGRWHHFVARRKGTTLSYFLDGKTIADLTEEIIGSSIGTILSPEEDQKLILGYDQTNPSATRFVGDLSELTVWNRALPIQEITTGLADLDGNEDGLVAYFPIIPLDEAGEISSQAKAKPPILPTPNNPSNGNGNDPQGQNVANVVTPVGQNHWP